jgi:hypothetical protein
MRHSSSGSAGACHDLPHLPPLEAVPHAPPFVRTVAIVAAELEAATIAATKVKALTEELRGMLFKKRGPRKAV